jgi:hypothetical protein
MGDFFKTVTSGLGRYVFAWLLPSALAVGVLVAVVSPSSSPSSPLAWMVERGTHGPLPPAVVLIFVILSLAVVSGYLASALYRLCEGYHLPAGIKRRLLRRHLRVWWRTRYVSPSQSGTSATRGLDLERRWQYPERETDVMPTRLGNALRNAETYGRNRWNLDFLTMWHELVALAPAPLARELDDTRSGLDFFMSTIVTLAVVAAISLTSIIGASDIAPLVVAGVALVLIWPSYLAAVYRVAEYRSALQALANVTRLPLAASLGYNLPTDLVRERFMWANLTRFIRDGDLSRGQNVDRYRTSTKDPTLHRSSELPADHGPPYDAAP